MSTICALTAIFLIAGAVRVDAAPTRLVQATVGDLAVPIQATRVSGASSLDLTQHSGHVVIIDFWATWCGPCRAVAPVLDALHTQHAAAGLHIIGVSDENRAVVAAHQQRRPVGYTLAAHGGLTHRAYRINALPSLAVIDKTGKLRHMIRGFSRGSVGPLQTLVSTLLAE